MTWSAVIDSTALTVRLEKPHEDWDCIGPSNSSRPDGYKFLLPNNEWVAFRASGTEPLIRCYIEAKSQAQLKKLDQQCRKLLAA